MPEFDNIPEDFFDKVNTTDVANQLASITVGRFNGGTGKMEIIAKVSKPMTFDEFRKKFRPGVYQLRATKKGGGTIAYCPEYPVGEAEGNDETSGRGAGGRTDSPTQSAPMAGFDANALQNAITNALTQSLSGFNSRLAAIETRANAAPADPIEAQIKFLEQQTRLVNAQNGFREAIVAPERKLRKEIEDEVADELNEQANNNDGDDDEGGDVMNAALGGLMNGIANKFGLTGGGSADDVPLGNIGGHGGEAAA